MVIWPSFHSIQNNMKQYSLILDHSKEQKQQYMNKLMNKRFIYVILFRSACIESQLCVFEQLFQIDCNKLVMNKNELMI